MAQQADGSRQSFTSASPSGGPPILAHPPIDDVVRPPGPALLSRILWVASFIAGIAVVVTSFFARDSHFDRLKGVIAGKLPDGDALAVEGATAVVFLGSLAMLALVVAMEAVLLAVAFKRRSWARWLLAPLILLHAVVTVITADYVVAPGGAGVLSTVLLAVQYVMAAAGLILLFLPSTTAWLLSGRRRATEI
ncbi:hypothetical protein AB4Y87_05940 [Paenarthrobacter sp. RAF54_2]|uniref:hypothetical protein n=1 Tax=Paenarthrobacter sp. RAF54_2 TaxID=3233061 RepID=UPI003F9D6F5F